MLRSSSRVSFEEATQLLIASLDDSHPGVQRAAINAPRGHLSSPAHYQQILSVVRSGKTRPANDPLLVNLLYDKAHDPVVERILKLVLARASNDPPLRARLSRWWRWSAFWP